MFYSPNNYYVKFIIILCNSYYFHMKISKKKSNFSSELTFKKITILSGTMSLLALYFRNSTSIFFFCNKNCFNRNFKCNYINFHQVIIDNYSCRWNFKIPLF